MGILDDAIREHLELKRQHGADSGDVERLEKEAFGPPTRPGDPEFDTSEEEAAGAAPASVAEAPTTVAPEAPSETDAPSEAPAPPEGGAGIFDAETDESDEDWLASLEDVVEPPALEQDAAASPHMPTESVEQPLPPRSESSAPDTSESLLPVPEPSGDTGEDDLSPAEQARVEHAELGDTVAHEAIPDPAAAPETGEEPAAGEPPEPPESAIFDNEEDLDDLDLELDIDEAEEASAPRSDDPAAGSGPAVEDPQVGRSVPVEPDSEEHAVEPEPTSGEMEIPASGGTDEFEADDAEEDDLEDEDEDLLEETPDFLQDTPEGDRLWFEQSGPKDFDFEDDDD